MPVYNRFLEGKLTVRSLKLFTLVFPAALLCGSSFAEMVQNPVYDAWNIVGEGASVTSVTKSEAIGTTLESEMKMTLVELTDEKK